MVVVVLQAMDITCTSLIVADVALSVVAVSVLAFVSFNGGFGLNDEGCSVDVFACLR